MTGIYKITNLINNKVYIGQSIDCQRRWTEHKRSGRINPISTKNTRDYNVPIHCAIRKYGVENFQFEIIEECERNVLDTKEQYWIEFYKSNIENKGYNLTGGGQKNFSLKGEKHSQAKLSQKQVDEIYDLLQNHTEISIRQIGKIYDVVPSLISLINSGKNWRKENCEYPLRPANYSLPGEKNPRAKLTAAIVKEMRQKKDSGISPKDIYEEYQKRYGIKERTLRAALYGESWKNI